MDKLEPVIRHRFWVLLGLCLPLIIYGYMSASGAMQAETEKREGELEQAYTGVPNGGPNESWQQGLHEINEELDLEVALAHYGILQKQQEDMDWPPGVVPYVPEEYRGEFDRDAGFFFRDEYEKQLRDAYLIAQPITPDGKGGYTGKVSFAYESMPRHEFGRNENFVSSKRMWDAQEDLWFLRQLLEAVRNVNANADNIAKAPLRMINLVELMGGDGQLGGSGSVGASGTGGGAMEMEMEMEYNDVMSDYEEGSFEEGLGEGGGMMGANVSVAFDPEEEFGKSIAARTVATGEESSGIRPGGPSAREEIRYIALDENQPYRERGFYMSVLINQQRIPDFLITLSNSRWPIRIVRFHVGPNPHGGSPAAAGRGQDPYGGVGYEEFGEIGDYELAMSEAAGDYGESRPAYGPRPNMVNDAALAGAFSHPDLVQLEVLGAITFFNPLPEDVLAKVQTALQETDASSGVPAGAEPPLSEPDSAASEDESAGVEDGTSSPPAAGEGDSAPDGAAPDAAAPTS